MLLLLACRPPGPVVVSADEVGIVEQSDEIQGRDGGESAVLFGRSTWIFGDTVLNVEDVDGRTWHHNSYAFRDDSGALVDPDDPVGAPAYLIPPTEEEWAFNDAHWDDGDCEEPCGARWAIWPGSPAWDAENERAYVFYGLIYAEPGSMNFEGRGESVATWTDPDGVPERPSVDPDAEHPDLVWQADEGAWGNGAVVDDGHLYTFGCPQVGLGRPCSLARVSVDAVADPDAWTYWDGEAWGADPGAAAELFEGAPILSVAWNEHLGAWLLVYSPPFDDGIFARTAPELTGPWSAATVIYTATGDAPYDAVHHPELAESDGRVEYVTYSRGTDDGSWFGSEFALVRVELD